MDSYYDMLDLIMSYFDLYPHDVPNYPGYTCDTLGNVYRPDGSRIMPFNSSGYKQVYMKDKDGKGAIKGVHQVVAMTFKPEYYPGCVVHHKDENKGRNYEENLEVESRNDHSRHHANPDAMLEWQKKNGGPVNKGQKMSAEFCEKCRQSALNRWSSQHTNQDGSKKK